MDEEIQTNDIIGKNIFVILKSGRKYSGHIDKINNSTCYMTDKFKQLVLFDFNEISSLEVQPKDGKD